MKNLVLSRYAVSSCVAAAMFAGCGGGVSSLASPASGDIPAVLASANAFAHARKKSQTFIYTGKKQTFTVPPGVTRIRVKAMGAGTTLAHGGLAAATIAVQPEESLAIFVGGAPKGIQGGYNGGGTGGYCNLSSYCPLVGEGGAGASDVREGGNAVIDRVLVAGGAGGTGGTGQHHGGAGGSGGGLTGIHGHAGKGCFIASHNATVGGGGGGGGGKRTKGGNGGKAGTTNNENIVVPGVKGAKGTFAGGGTGASNAYGDLLAGGAGGGGGGGYYGGGGGGSGASGCSPPPCFGQGVGSGGGGGGGSSFVETSAKNVTIERRGGSAGAGLIVISW